jgi:hypothetical protein
MSELNDPRLAGLIHIGIAIQRPRDCGDGEVKSFRHVTNGYWQYNSRRDIMDDSVLLVLYMQFSLGDNYLISYLIIPQIVLADKQEAIASVRNCFHRHAME